MSQPKNEIVTVELPSCPICAEHYTSVVRKKVNCNSCRKETCSKCVEKYMMSTVEDPHCMHCRNAWNRAFLTTFLSVAFLNKTYYAYRQTVLLNREKSFLPQYQGAAERALKVRALEKEDNVIKERYEELDKIRQQELYALSRERTALWHRIQNVRAGREDLTTGGASSRAAATKFIRRCTSNGCNGFLSSAWKCGLCSLWACPDCFEIKGADRDAAHTCTADALATAALIRKDTKPCPSCGEMISKIDGCDQMFCTSCHKPFSWNTGQSIRSGAIHNPHYFQWLAKGGREAPANPGFVPCGGLPNPYHVQTALQHAPKKDRKVLLDILRMCTHISDVERHRYERHLNPVNNEELGVQYLLKEKDEDEWKLGLARREKDRQKCNEIRDILEAFHGATIDVFRRIDAGRNPPYPEDEAHTLIRSICTELEALRQFIFQSMIEVSKSFNCSVPLLNDQWQMEHGSIQTMNRRKKQAAEAEVTAAAAAAAAEAAATVAAAAAAAEAAATEAAAATAAAAAAELQAVRIARRRAAHQRRIAAEATAAAEAEAAAAAAATEAATEAAAEAAAAAAAEEAETAAAAAVFQAGIARHRAAHQRRIAATAAPVTAVAPAGAVEVPIDAEARAAQEVADRAFAEEVAAEGEEAPPV